VSIVTFRMPAPEGTLWDKESAGALIGETTILEMAGHRSVVVVTDVAIADDGEALLITARVPDEIAAHIP
jgi:hypothetical protein